MLKEALVAYFQILFQYFSGRTHKSTENLNQYCRYFLRDSNRISAEHSYETLPRKQTDYKLIDAILQLTSVTIYMYIYIGTLLRYVVLVLFEFCVKQVLLNRN